MRCWSLVDQQEGEGVCARGPLGRELWWRALQRPGCPLLFTRAGGAHCPLTQHQLSPTSSWDLPPPPHQEKTELRSASIRLFGHLNQVCHGGCEDVFLEQVVAGLVPLLLHLQDPQAPVTNVSHRRGRASRAPLTGQGLKFTPCRPAGSPCACAAPTCSMKSWRPSSRSTYRRAGACTSGSSSTPPASSW